MFVKKILLIAAVSLFSAQAFAEVYKCTAGVGIDPNHYSKLPIVKFNWDTNKDFHTGATIGEISEGVSVRARTTRNITGTLENGYLSFYIIIGPSNSESATQYFSTMVYQGSPYVFLSGEINSESYFLVCKK